MAALVYLLLCLSLHACNGRHLRVTDQGPESKVQFIGKNKDAGNINPQDAFIPSKLVALDKVMAKNDAANLKLKDLLVVRKEEKDIKGSTSMISSSQELLQQVSETEAVLDEAAGKDGLLYACMHACRGHTEARIRVKGGRRFIQESAPHDAEETVDSKGNDILEDVVVMDYAQPHRKPPIHNRKP